LAFLTVACGGKKEKKAAIPAADTIPVQVMELRQSSAGQEFHVSGQFTTDDETYLSFLSGGVIRRIFVKEGDRIRKGQVLATLDVTAINAMVSQAKTGLAKAKRDLDRARNLHRDGYATLEQLQNAQSAYEVAEQQLQSAQFNRKYAEIRAVSNGFVLKKLANQGQLVASGTPVFQTNGAGTRSWMLRVGVSDAQWSAIRIGDKAEIKSDVFPGKKMAAKVTRKAESIDPFSGTFAVDLQLTDSASSASLASGVFGKATIFSSTQSAHWYVPYAALLDGNANEGFVFVTNDLKTVKKVPVTIGGLHQDQVEITAGLESWKYIVVSGSAYLSESSAIVVR
jgi:RND family efflux transporter MFP subunit